MKRPSCVRMGARLASMREANPGTSCSAESCEVVAVKRRPCPSMHSRETMLSEVRPQAVACGPHALLATIPAIVARFWEEGSGPKRRPYLAAAACRVEPTQPGSTVAVRASGSMEMTRFMYREKSRTRPGPIALDAHEVPPPRAVRGTPWARARWKAATACSGARGKATARGGMRVRPASEE